MISGLVGEVKNKEESEKREDEVKVAAEVGMEGGKLEDAERRTTQCHQTELQQSQ